MQSSFHVPPVSASPVIRRIVSAYFSQWAKMVVPHAKKMMNKIGFLDLVSGTGKDEDGSEAAPYHVLKTALESDELANMLITIFGDKEQRNVIRLRQLIANMEGVEKLEYSPQFEKVVSSDDLICSLQQLRYMPSLIVVEPFTIKDLNLEQISARIKEWNFDCIFLLHYNQLERTVENPFKAKYLEVTFGKAAADKLRAVAERLHPQQRESFIVNTFVDALKGLKSYHSIILTYTQGSDIYYIVFATRYTPRYRLMNDMLMKAGYYINRIAGQEPGPVEKVNPSVQAGLFN